MFSKHLKVLPIKPIDSIPMTIFLIEKELREKNECWQKIKSFQTLKTKNSENTAHYLRGAHVDVECTREHTVT